MTIRSAERIMVNRSNKRNIEERNRTLNLVSQVIFEIDPSHPSEGNLPFVILRDGESTYFICPDILPSDSDDNLDENEKYEMRLLSLSELLRERVDSEENLLLYAVGNLFNNRNKLSWMANTGGGAIASGLYDPELMKDFDTELTGMLFNMIFADRSETVSLHGSVESERGLQLLASTHDMGDNSYIKIDQTRPKSEISRDEMMKISEQLRGNPFEVPAGWDQMVAQDINRLTILFDLYNSN